MKKPDIVKEIRKKYPYLEEKTIKKVVDGIFDAMINALANGERIEIRNLGSFKVTKRKKPLKGKRRISYSKTVLFRPGKVIKNSLKNLEK
ncbi:MAG: HU family DNA-binding protein [Hydrogenothermaceae bacterium]|nr:HU family DNA-binding protein [Hydrogenothermaceae bacterium]